MVMTTVPPDVSNEVDEPVRRRGVARADGERGPAVLIGRTRESSQLESLFAEARPGGSRVLVLRGELGIGKTDLLEYAVSSAPGWRVVRTVGVESEAELPFAALQQLCSSSLDLLEGLPGPQRDALSVAFGLTLGDRRREVPRGVGDAEPIFQNGGRSAAYLCGRRCAVARSRVGPGTVLCGPPINERADRHAFRHA